jgi:type IV pilus assembly protein PilC
MPVFEYKGRDAQTAEQKEGKIKAGSREEAVSYLRSEKRIDIATISEVKKQKTVEEYFNRWREIPFDSIVSFTRNLATMLDAGIPILSTMETMVEQEENDKLKAVLENVLADIATGVGIADSMAPHTEAFEPLYIAMVKAGEESGDIGMALQQLATQLEQTQKLRRSIKSAMIYPKVVIGISSIIISALLIFIVPKFAQIFKDTASQLSTPDHPINPQLPTMTRVIVSISHALYPAPGTAGHNILWWGQVFLRLAILAVAVVFFKKLFKVALRKPEVHRRWDALKMRLPFKMGLLVKKIAIARFARTLSALRAAGVAPLESMGIVAEAAGNFVVAEAILHVRDEMQKGDNIAGPLERTGVFPPMVCKYVSTGEETGNLESMLERLATTYEQEVDLQIQGLTKVIEPLMIIVVGGMIGTIVIATYLPMFSLYNLIQ